MKLTAEINGKQMSVHLERHEEAGGRRFITANVDGRRLELSASEPEPGVYVLLSDHRVFECRVIMGAEGELYEVRVRNRVFRVALLDPKRLRAQGQSTGGGASGAAIIKAPMPGKVLRVLTEVGATIEAGEGVLVVEAMKMQNELKTAKAGRVVELRVAAGATVNAGDVLAVIE